MDPRKLYYPVLIYVDHNGYDQLPAVEHDAERNPTSPLATGGLTPPIFHLSLYFINFLLSLYRQGEGLPSPYPCAG